MMAVVGVDVQLCKDEEDARTKAFFASSGLAHGHQVGR